MAKTILILEDNTSLKGAYSMKFSEFNLIIVNDGQSGLDMLKNFTPDAIILDIYMPIMDGEEFLRRVETTAPIIVVTNSESEYNGKVTKKLHKTTSLQTVYNTVTELL